MGSSEPMPDATAIMTLDDLAKAFGRLRRRAARPGQLQLSVRDLAARTKRAASTLDPYLRGLRLCPADVYEELLRALDVQDLRPWLDAWERLADAAPARRPRPQALHYLETFRYRAVGPAYRGDVELGIIAGDLRRVTGVDIWVNSENTEMRMSRFEEHSVSAIIRFEGATHDETGRVVDDRIADELAAKVAGRQPVAAGTAFTTGAGELLTRNGVRYVIHVAAVQGEPGEGYRPIADIGRCVTTALAEAERLAARSILFPLLGTGVAGGPLEPTIRAMVGAALDHVQRRDASQLRGIYLLASSPAEREVCLAVMDTIPVLAAVAGH